MAAKVSGETVKCPGQMVISTYAMVPDVTLTANPALKPEGGALFYVDIGGGKNRMGGSSLAQCYCQPSCTPRTRRTRFAHTPTQPHQRSALSAAALRARSAWHARDAHAADGQ